MSLYLDTSGLVKTLVNEPGSVELAAELGRHSAHFTARIAYTEVCAALARAERLLRLTGAERDSCIRVLVQNWTHLERVAVDEDLVMRAGDLAVKFGLRGYDAVHLAAALEVRHVGSLMFAAWDRDLRAAAAASGLALFPAVV